MRGDNRTHPHQQRRLARRALSVLATFAIMDRARYDAVRAERAKEREAVQAKLLGGLQLPPNTVNSNVIIH